MLLKIATDAPQKYSFAYWLIKPSFVYMRTDGSASMLCVGRVPPKEAFVFEVELIGESASHGLCMELIVPLENYLLVLRTCVNSMGELSQNRPHVVSLFGESPFELPHVWETPFSDYLSAWENQVFTPVNRRRKCLAIAEEGKALGTKLFQKGVQECDLDSALNDVSDTTNWADDLTFKKIFQVAVYLGYYKADQETIPFIPSE